jgi:hypothetical protein
LDQPGDGSGPQDAQTVEAQVKNLNRGHNKVPERTNPATAVAHNYLAPVRCRAHHDFYGTMFPKPFDTMVGSSGSWKPNFFAFVSIVTALSADEPSHTEGASADEIEFVCPQWETRSFKGQRASIPGAGRDSDLWRGKVEVGVKAGAAAFVHAGGSILYAEFRGNVFEGVGVCQYAEGSMYYGEFRASKHDGLGWLEIPGEAGRITYKGEFQADAPHGVGHYLSCENCTAEFVRFDRGEFASRTNFSESIAEHARIEVAVLDVKVCRMARMSCARAL